MTSINTFVPKKLSTIQCHQPPIKDDSKPFDLSPLIKKPKPGIFTPAELEKIESWLKPKQ